MTVRKTVRVVAYLTALIAVLVGYGIRMKMRADRYATELQNRYAYTRSSLDSGLTEISLLLRKAEVSNSAKGMSELATDLITQSELTKTALSQMTPSYQAETLNRFLSQVGNYALWVSESIENGNPLTEEQEEKLGKLCSSAEKIVKAVEKSLDSTGWENPVEAVEKAISLSDGEKSFLGLEEQLSDYPTLIYDGPYSDHLLSGEREALKKEPLIKEAKALKIASAWASLPQSKLHLSGKTKGNIPTFVFAGNGATVGVSEHGGKVLYFRKERTVSEVTLTGDSCLPFAEAFLKARGMTHMKETYYACSRGVCTVNFAYMEGNVICYTDLMKVSVAMDNGEIVGYEAAGYWVNHKERNFAPMTLSVGQAQKKLNRNLTVLSVRPALIPDEKRTPKLCWEFLCETKEKQKVLVYLGGETGEEENILLLTQKDGGTLVQ